jgi:hypothetical protein
MAQANNGVQQGGGGGFFKNLMNRGNGANGSGSGANNGAQNQQQSQQRSQGSSPNGQQQQQRNGQQGNQQQQNLDPSKFKFDPTTGKPLNGNTGSNDPENQSSPLSVYEGLWKEAAAGEEDQPPAFTIKPETIKSVADSLSFSGKLPEDLDMSEFTEGQRNALMSIIDHVGRQSYSTSIDHASKLTDKWYGMRSTHDNKKFPGMIKDTLAFSGIDNMEVAQKNPIVRENMRMIGAQLRKLHPDATPEWITQQTSTFFKDMAEALHPDMGKQQEIQKEQQSKAPGGEDFDWNTWVNSSLRNPG